MRSERARGACSGREKRDLKPRIEVSACHERRGIARTERKLCEDSRELVHDAKDYEFVRFGRARRTDWRHEFCF